jgi:transcriptional regulator with XRE-family HTH domain
MSSIGGSGYNKNENGVAFPSLETLSRLAMADNISMDWFLFNKGPLKYNEKERAEEIEELKKQLALKTESAKGRERVRKADGAEVEAEIQELAAHMEAIPLLYHEILTHFQRFKIDNRALVEGSMVSSDR